MTWKTKNKSKIINQDIYKNLQKKAIELKFKNGKI